MSTNNQQTHRHSLPFFDRACLVLMCPIGDIKSVMLSVFNFYSVPCDMQIN